MHEWKVKVDSKINHFRVITVNYIWLNVNYFNVVSMLTYILQSFIRFWYIPSDEKKRIVIPVSDFSLSQHCCYHRNDQSKCCYKVLGVKCRNACDKLTVDKKGKLLQTFYCSLPQDRDWSRWNPTTRYNGTLLVQP